jgi:hypothetical protein
MRARPLGQASRRILTGITCSGTPGSARRPRYGTARCAASARVLLSDARWKTRVAEWIPPDIAEQIPLDLLGLITGLPAETARIPGMALKSGLSSIRRTPAPIWLFGTPQGDSPPEVPFQA